MTIRDMLNAGIEIQGRIRVLYWNDNDEPVVMFNDYAEFINNQPFLDMEVKYMFDSGDHRITFEVAAEED